MPSSTVTQVTVALAIATINLIDSDGVHKFWTNQMLTNGVNAKNAYNRLVEIEGSGAAGALTGEMADALNLFA